MERDDEAMAHPFSHPFTTGHHPAANAAKLGVRLISPDPVQTNRWSHAQSSFIALFLLTRQFSIIGLLADLVSSCGLHIRAGEIHQGIGMVSQPAPVVLCQRAYGSSTVTLEVFDVP